MHVHIGVALDGGSFDDMKEGAGERRGQSVLDQEQDLANCLRSTRVRQECARLLLRPATRLPFMRHIARELSHELELSHKLGHHKVLLLAPPPLSQEPAAQTTITLAARENAAACGPAVCWEEGGGGGERGDVWAVGTIDTIVHASVMCQEMLRACRWHGELMYREVQGGVEEVAALVSSLEEREWQQVYRDDERERELVRALDERTNAEMSFDASQIIVSDLVARLREAEREMQAATLYVLYLRQAKDAEEDAFNGAQAAGQLLEEEVSKICV
jgi:hypothetical protein